MLTTRVLQLFALRSFFFSRDCFDRLLWFCLISVFVSVNILLELIGHEDFLSFSECLSLFFTFFTSCLSEFFVCIYIYICVCVCTIMYTYTRTYMYFQGRLMDLKFDLIYSCVFNLVSVCTHLCLCLCACCEDLFYVGLNLPMTFFLLFQVMSCHWSGILALFESFFFCIHKVLSIDKLFYFQAI